MLPLNVTLSPFVATSEELRLTRLIVKSVAIPIVVVFGVLGNVLNIVVLTRKWMRSSTNYYLTSLAIYDILYLVFVATWILRQNDIVRVCLNIASNTGVWLTLTFTIERYICVCHPMRGIVLCTPKRAKYVIAGVCVAGALVTFPEFFEQWLDQWQPYQIGYRKLNQTLFTYMPLALLCVFNTLLIRIVMLASRQRLAMTHETSSRHGRREAEQSRVTTLLIIVVVVFLVSQLPQAVMNTIAPSPTDNVIILNNIFNLLVVVNSAVNFVLYSSVSTKFRRTFRHVFLRCASRGDPTRLNIFSDGISHASPMTQVMTQSPAVCRTDLRVNHQIGYDTLVKSDGKSTVHITPKSLVKNDFLQVNQCR